MFDLVSEDAYNLGLLGMYTENYWVFFWNLRDHHANRGLAVGLNCLEWCSFSLISQSLPINSIRIGVCGAGFLAWTLSTTPLFSNINAGIHVIDHLCNFGAEGTEGKLSQRSKTRLFHSNPLLKIQHDPSLNH